MAEIIDNIKSIIKSKKGQITSKEAIKIQAEHLELLATRKKAKKVYSPPYKEIEKQIFDANDQIAQCAVFNLVSIAINTPKYKNAIIKILTELSTSKALSKEVKAYIKDSLKKID